MSFVTTEKVSRALIFVADVLEKEGVSWLLGASGALFVWGIDVVPQDLDIFVSASDVIRLEKVFKKDLTNPLHYFQEGNKKYLEFQMKVYGLEVEICELDLKNNHHTLVDFERRKIPVNFLEEELEFYQNRSGKKDRIRLIKKRLKELSSHK